MARGKPAAHPPLPQTGLKPRPYRALCSLREGETEVEVMSFGEWVKTRENEAGGEGTEITLP